MQIESRQEPVPLQSRKWRLDGTAPLSACSWESAHFAFHPASGQTHFLNDTCVDILALLADEALDAQTIYSRLLVAAASDEDADFKSGVVGVIQLLDQLGLIEAVA